MILVTMLTVIGTAPPRHCLLILTDTPMPILRDPSHALQQAFCVIKHPTDKESPAYSGFPGLIPPGSALVL